MQKKSKLSEIVASFSKTHSSSRKKDDSDDEEIGKSPFENNNNAIF